MAINIGQLTGQATLSTLDDAARVYIWNPTQTGADRSLYTEWSDLEGYFSLVGHIHSGGDITSGVVASAYLDADTAHLTTTQTFTGDKTFSGALKVNVISERTTASGVTIDGLLLKDQTIRAPSGTLYVIQDPSGNFEVYDQNSYRSIVSGAYGTVGLGDTTGEGNGTWLVVSDFDQTVNIYGASTTTKIQGTLKTSTINEYGSGTGVTIDGVLIKDGFIDYSYISNHPADAGGDFMADGSVPMTGQLDIDLGTLTDPKPAIDITATWNDGADTFEAFTIDITDTASASASTLMDLKVGGSSKFKVGKDGATTASGTVYGQNGNFSSMYSGGSNVNSSGMSVLPTARIGFTPVNWYDTTDVNLYRDAAGILAQRVGTAAQESRIYNTYTDASNGEWLEFGFQDTTNTAVIKTNANGTGTVRDLMLNLGYTKKLRIKGEGAVSEPDGWWINQGWPGNYQGYLMIGRQSQGNAFDWALDTNGSMYANKGITIADNQQIGSPAGSIANFVIHNTTLGGGRIMFHGESASNQSRFQFYSYSHDGAWNGQDVMNLYGQNGASQVVIQDELQTDLINERVSGAGVTVDGVLIKDGIIAADSLADVMQWNEVVGTTKSASPKNGYVINNASLVTVTLPATATVGARIALTGLGAGGWKLAQNDGQIVHFSAQSTTPGTGGYLSSQNRYDCIEIQCVITNTTWVVRHSMGDILVI